VRTKNQLHWRPNCRLVHNHQQFSRLLMPNGHPHKMTWTMEPGAQLSYT
jgi:hypothetical protein